MKRIVFMGTPDFSVPILQALTESDYEMALVVTQPDRPVGRKRVMTPPPVKVAAEQLNIPVFQPEKLREHYQVILDYKPDIIITAAYGQLLPNELLEAPEFGCINVHASLLPELRGGAPIHYAIIQGKEETGVTIMYMAEKLDAGDIISQRRIPIEHDEHAGSLHDKLSELGKDLLLDTLPDIFEGKIKAIPQDETKATFASNITRRDEKIDWSKSHIEVYNQIRGLNPWPVAFTTFNNKTVKIWWAELDEKTYDCHPGEIVDVVNEEAIVVCCGNQKAVRITEIQPAGKKRMTVKAFLLGYRDEIEVGKKMG
ncbi:methionyl-tRNA formyltransferase [Cerasibacillus quisquiliarum]|uniref:Methionyl-tRNA formyltransferase n=1 Tax=Cerasibacillus quisquiliarum TaxID=227865 RepID=A0A511UUV4_9BACI|nr:methionyl-tRNA formyltransferase [Cerasibacillus quisquiliarum]MBB5145808.1 methionyl-tRNA formyltransferase [Cerasibacillus quisquiliarum]GEN30379.1 methionyl-tRNA formyltransferase [Cerasibacillus quisquiliarum]